MKIRKHKDVDGYYEMVSDDGKELCALIHEDVLSNFKVIIEGRKWPLGPHYFNNCSEVEIVGRIHD